jgi:predicted GNAT family acetyltransferase
MLSSIGGRCQWRSSVPDKVTDNRAEYEFEFEVDGLRAIAAYQLEGDTIVFTHTLVPKKLEGHGVGSKLIRGALDAARDRGLKVVPQCPFVKAYIERHAEYRDLLA